MDNDKKSTDDDSMMIFVYIVCTLYKSETEIDIPKMPPISKMGIILDV